MTTKRPDNQGLYFKDNEKDSCGIGIVANIKGKKSYDIIRRGLQVLERMEHRGAESADNKTGDGAGILMQIRHTFYKSVVSNLPDAGNYGTGHIFLTKNKISAQSCLTNFENTLKSEGLEIIAYRDIEVDSSQLGEIAKRSEPDIKQIFVKPIENHDQQWLEKKLYIVRKLAENNIRNSSIEGRETFYLPSFSTKTIVYKGMLMPSQVLHYFKDLQNDKMESAISLVHSRFSTNTFPSWDLAQPFRMIAHNGEINTIKGNRFWMSARESNFISTEFGDDIKKIFPVIEPDKSDSASFDNALEMMVATGRSIPHALMMMIPESWNDKNPISQDLKYFYEYHACFMEPWDGPASIVFCDGRYVGGTLDRNGLRPSRYVITNDDMIVMGSEVGVQTFPADKIISKGRLMPGKLLLVDTEEGRIIPDSEIKEKICHQKPYKQWVEKNRINISNINPSEKSNETFPDNRINEMMKLFGYTREDVGKLIPHLAEDGHEITSSMGTDTPIAAFSDKPQKLYNYFKQIFAQVTNPAIDSIREELVMTTTSLTGTQKNLLSETEEHCRMIKLLNPVISNDELYRLRKWNNPNFKIAEIDITYNTQNNTLEKALDEICGLAEKYINEGSTLIILSDKNFSKNNIPIPALLATSTIHHHLIKVKKRTSCGLIIESAEPKEVHHFALLFGYGADIINPYGVLAVINNLVDNKKISVESYEKAEYNFLKGLGKSILKIMSKMGTSTIRSYRGSQIFEAIGLGNDVIDKSFTGTKSRIGGIGFQEIETEMKIFHDNAYNSKRLLLDSEGVYSYRNDGEKHGWNPETIHLLQWATRTNDYNKFKQFSAKADELTKKPHFIRGLFEFKKCNSIPIDEVESIDEIMKRFTTGAMSFGSISRDAHEAIAEAMNSIKGRSNSGEGGEDPTRYYPQKNGKYTRSAIKQVASGRFGVTSNYLANADELQIKVAQGAKPGEGGQLPGPKVFPEIAKVRFSTPGVTLISPPPHHDIYSIEDLAQLIFDLKNANPTARISVKLVSETGVGTIAAGVAKAHADNILVSGYEGGTGASPQSSIKHAGLPMEIGISETHQTLVMNDLRGRVRLQTDGQIKTGRDIVMAGMLGAEEFGFGTSTLIVLGCVMMRKCHENTCPFGVATQDEELRKRFTGKAEHLINFFKFLAQEVREIMSELGIRKFNELIGNTGLLEIRKVNHYKASKVDPSAILYRPLEADKYANYCIQNQVHKIEDILDRKIIEKCKNAIEKEEKISLKMEINNTNRAVGTMLSYNISKLYGEEGLPDDTINVDFQGSAGQSFGAFLAKGVTFKLEGDSNDYFGKGLSGGRLIVVPQEGTVFKAEENIIVGNTVLYGATKGEAFVRGIAGERFCVRNSGAYAVVEGTGDHCAEYMTGGRLVVLGKIGRNFAAGMSGGIAFVYDVDGNFDYFCNKGMVELTPVTNSDDEQLVLEMIIKHIKYTDSPLAKEMVSNWNQVIKKFIKVMPFEYKRVLQEIKIQQTERKIKSIIEEEQLGRSI